MGIIKNIFKGIGKVFKKIGKGIKKAFKAFGKFMGKIGFVGQLAMMFLFPAGIGSMFLKGLGKLGATLASATGNSVFSAAARGIGNVLTFDQSMAVADDGSAARIQDPSTAVSADRLPLVCGWEGVLPKFFKCRGGGKLYY